MGVGSITSQHISETHYRAMEVNSATLKSVLDGSQILEKVESLCLPEAHIVGKSTSALVKTKLVV
jgi:hypothetical protein